MNPRSPSASAPPKSARSRRAAAPRAAKPSLRDRIKQATSEQILDAAEAAFAELGIHGAHMGEIAARAGMAVGTLYNHFADKDALLDALHDARRREILTRIDVALGERGFRRQLTGFLEALWAHFAAHRKFFLILLEAELGNGRVTSKKKVAMREVYGRLQKLVDAGIQQKVLRSDPEQMFPTMLMGIVRSMAIRVSCMPEVGPEVPIERLVEFFLDGAGARRG